MQHSLLNHIISPKNLKELQTSQRKNNFFLPTKTIQPLKDQKNNQVNFSTYDTNKQGKLMELIQKQNQ